MYDDDWRGLRRRVGHAFEFDWEYVFQELTDLTDCLLETTWNEMDPTICLEGRGKIALYGPYGEPTGPSPPPGKLMSYPSDDCHEQIVIPVRVFLNADFNAGTFRLWLRMKISQCRGILKKITIYGTREDLSKIGIHGKKQKEIMALIEKLGIAKKQMKRGFLLKKLFSITWVLDNFIFAR